jgi:ribosomal protein S18 acetylase RimI-like enzyme
MTHTEQIGHLRQAIQGERAPVTIRTDLRTGDVERVVSLHTILYARERGFDASFEAYTAGPIADFVRAGSPRGRLWLAEREGQLVGCIAVVPISAQTAQLRWFLVDPSARRAGLGKSLLSEALQFCRQCGYAEVVLWTESALTVAARLYRAAGFRKTEEKPGRVWGVDLVEEKYELKLR